MIEPERSSVAVEIKQHRLRVDVVHQLLLRVRKGKQFFAVRNFDHIVKSV